MNEKHKGIIILGVLVIAAAALYFAHRAGAVSPVSVSPVSVSPAGESMISPTASPGLSAFTQGAPMPSPVDLSININAQAGMLAYQPLFGFVGVAA